MEPLKGDHRERRRSGGVVNPHAALALVWAM